MVDPLQSRVFLGVWDTEGSGRHVVWIVSWKEDVCRSAKIAYRTLLVLRKPNNKQVFIVDICYPIMYSSREGQVTREL